MIMFCVVDCQRLHAILSPSYSIDANYFKFIGEGCPAEKLKPDDSKVRAGLWVCPVMLPVSHLGVPDTKPGACSPARPAHDDQSMLEKMARGARHLHLAGAEHKAQGVESREHRTLGPYRSLPRRADISVRQGEGAAEW